MNTTRDPDETRRSLLDAGFKEIHEVGFRSASVDRILSSTGVTKGALYHHFQSKTDLGYAVVDEVLANHILDHWVRPLAGRDHPVDLIKGAIRANTARAEASGSFFKGCPINNLSVEMSQIDEGFRTRLELVFRLWRDAIASALRRGQQQGLLRPDFDADQTGFFVLSAFEGIAGMAKTTADTKQLYQLLDTLCEYLDGLRIPGDKVA